MAQLLLLLPEVVVLLVTGFKPTVPVLLTLMLVSQGRMRVILVITWCVGGGGVEGDHPT